MANGHNDANQIVTMAPSVVTTPSQHNSIIKEDRARANARDGSPKKSDKTHQFSFEDQLTFAPKLNPLSLKLAESKRTSVIDRFNNNNRYERGEDSVFTFKPVISTSSCKIIAKLKTDFWQRQKMHVERQKQTIEKGPSTIHPQIRLSPTLKVKLRRNSKSTSQKKDSCTMPPIHISKSDKDLSQEKPKRHIKSKRSTSCITALESFKVKRVEPDKTERLGKAPSRTKLSEIESNRPKQKLIPVEQAASRQIDFDKNDRIENKKKLKQSQKSNDKTDVVSPIKDTVLVPTNCDETEDVVQKKQRKQPRSQGKGQHRKLTDAEMDANHAKLMKAKQDAGKAIKCKKVFVCVGPYQTIRSSLRHRGWVEKYFKPASTVEDNISDRDDSDDNEKRETEKRSECKQLHKANRSNDDQNEEANEFSNDSQYGIMSRVVRNVTPTLIWTLKKDDIDFKVLKKDQIVNHFGHASSFTTKAGLCTHLKNSIFFANVRSLDFYPRCYVLGLDGGKEDFIYDYRITAAQNILKLTVSLHSKWKMLHLQQQEIEKNGTESRASGCRERSSSISSTSSLASVSSGMLTPTPSSRSPKTTKKIRRRSLIVLPAHVIFQAVKACRQYLEAQEHLDIEDKYDENLKMDNLTWDALIANYNQIVHHGAIVTDAHQHVDECKEILTAMKPFFPQLNIDGVRNIWIVKPGAKSRGRGIVVMSRLHEILTFTNENLGRDTKWVVQKYIERPLLVYSTKFDIRQWFLVTDWNPLVFWFYKDCYLRFCGQQFRLDNFDAQIHLSNNSIQKNYENGNRSEHLPDDNMWTSDTFKEYLRKRGNPDVWDKKIYPAMKSAIQWSLQCCQDMVELRKNSFELYGADFMLSEDFSPWLIEINSSPALGASTDVTEVLCREVIEDTFKVVIDRKDDKNCDIGKFEQAYKQQYIPPPSYMGCNLGLSGTMIRKPSLSPQKQVPKPFKVSPRETILAPLGDGTIVAESIPKEPADVPVAVKVDNDKMKMPSPHFRMTIRKEAEKLLSTKKEPEVLPSRKSPKRESPRKELPPKESPRRVEISQTQGVTPLQLKRITDCKCLQLAIGVHDHTCEQHDPQKCTIYNCPHEPGEAPNSSRGSPPDSPKTSHSTPKQSKNMAAVLSPYKLSSEACNPRNSAKLLAQYKRLSLSDASKAAQQQGVPQLLGTYNKLYVDQIDLKPGNGVVSIQNVFL